MVINVGAQSAVGAQYFPPLQATNVNEYLRWDGDKKIDALASISNKP